MKIITRKEAQEKKLKRYFTGIPCSKGHISERHTINHSCIECNNERARAFRKPISLDKAKKKASLEKKICSSYKEGQRKTQIAQKFNISITTVTRVLNKNKVFDRQDRGAPKTLYQPKIGDKFNNWECIDGPKLIDGRNQYKFKCKCGFSKWYPNYGDVIKGRSKMCESCKKTEGRFIQGADLVGETFGKRKVIEYKGKDDLGNKLWLTQCQCEWKTEAIFASYYLMDEGDRNKCQKCTAKEVADLTNEKRREIITKRREEYIGEVPEDWFDLPCTRKDAEEIGSEYFFRGECRKGHVELWNTATGGCVKCNAENAKNWRKNNREKSNALDRAKRKRYSKDPFWRLVQNLRTRTAEIFSNINEVKDESTMELLGCSKEELKKWIEDKFYNHPKTKIKMTWSNYGKVTDEDNTWNVDHKIPISRAKNKKQLKDLTHYTNLQPMWAIENIKKGDKLIY